MWRLTDEERELRERIRSVVLEQIRPRVREMDENCDYPHDVHETLAKEGLMGLALPAEYATEAAEAVVALAFGSYDLHRDYGRLEARNLASARVLEKLGMRREAHLVENEWVKGEWQSELVYALLAREWRGR
jgi:alkylation response protein AidB-like acyl-CoA dehydrogenase